MARDFPRFIDHHFELLTLRKDVCQNWTHWYRDSYSFIALRLVLHGFGVFTPKLTVMTDKCHYMSVMILCLACLCSVNVNVPITRKRLNHHLRDLKNAPAWRRLVLVIWSRPLVWNLLVLRSSMLICRLAKCLKLLVFLMWGRLWTIGGASPLSDLKIQKSLGWSAIIMYMMSSVQFHHCQDTV